MQQAAVLETSCSPGFRAAEAMADSARRMLGIADALLATGRPVDLGGFEAQVARLCLGILTLPAAEGRALAPALARLRGQVEQLRAAMPRP